MPRYRGLVSTPLHLTVSWGVTETLLFCLCPAKLTFLLENADAFEDKATQSCCRNSILHFVLMHHDDLVVV
jgi:hypothetical protein